MFEISAHTYSPANKGLNTCANHKSLCGYGLEESKRTNGVRKRTLFVRT
jgi:hypothetical protein